MRTRFLVLAALATVLGAAPAPAGLDVPPAPPAPAPAPDLSGFATKDEVAASAPQPCAAVPSADTLMGSAGSANCYVPRDASRPTVVQAATVTTSADGVWSVTFGRAFSSSTPIVLVLPVNTAANPGVCNVSARSATGASGRCWQSSGITVGLVGSIINVFSSAGSMAVMVIAREPTQ